MPVAGTNCVDVSIQFAFLQEKQQKTCVSMNPLNEATRPSTAPQRISYGGNYIHGKVRLMATVMYAWNSISYHSECVRTCVGLKIVWIKVFSVQTGTVEMRPEKLIIYIIKSIVLGSGWVWWDTHDTGASSKHLRAIF